MLQLSVNQLSTSRWSFEEDVIHYAEAGFTAMGVWYPKLARYGEEKGRELLREYNLDISSLSLISGLTSSQGVTFRQCIVEALDVIQLAADLGAKTVVVVAGSRNGHTRNHAMRILRSALKLLAEAAEAVGVQLALEPTHIGCTGDSFLNTISQCLDVITEIDSPNMGINFDVYHVAQDTSVLSWIDDIAPLVRLVQLSDAKVAPLGQQNRCMLGHGRLPLGDMIQSFQRMGYSGYYEIELQGASIEQLDYRHLLSESRRTTGQWQSLHGSKT